MPTFNSSSIIAMPEFTELLRRRRRIVVPLVILILVAYFGFISLIAFDPSSLGQPIGDGLISTGICVGLGLLFLSFAIVGAYIRYADREIKDSLIQIRNKVG